MLRSKSTSLTEVVNFDNFDLQSQIPKVTVVLQGYTINIPCFINIRVQEDMEHYLEKSTPAYV